MRKGLFLIFLSCNALFGTELDEGVLICGVCRNVASAVPNTIANIERLGENFRDYRVIIYENNSNDGTKALFNAWARRSSRVIFISENLSKKDLHPNREVRIARARNITLDYARKLGHKNYKYLIMVDLDFTHPWPIREIVKSIQHKGRWDCISANGENRVLIKGKGKKKAYWDRYAFRDTKYPLGPEILGPGWWNTLRQTWFTLKKAHWAPVYSAYGGLAIYKTSTILKFSYSGVATKDLETYYRSILHEAKKSNPQIQEYFQLQHSRSFLQGGPFLFFAQPKEPMEQIICCEHVTLHASMALRGHYRFYVNPKMKMRYFK